MFDRAKLNKLKAVYAEAARVKKGSDTFMFEGNEFVLNYAKYLIEYLETMLPK